MRINKGILTALLCAFLLLAGFTENGHSGNGRLTVAGASDLSYAFKEIAVRFEKETGYKVVLSLGSTGMLARQIEGGAPFDVFFAANTAFIDALVKGGHIVPGSVEPYALGRLVIVTKASAGFRLTGVEGLRDPSIGRIAIANPEHAPYGIAAMEALKSRGLWDELKGRLVYGENIRQALQFVESGNAGAGIVAMSVAGVPGIVSAEVPARLHAPIRQAAGVVSRSGDPDGARSFIRFVNGPEGRAIMKRYGFVPPGADR